MRLAGHVTCSITLNCSRHAEYVCASYCSVSIVCVAVAVPLDVKLCCVCWPRTALRLATSDWWKLCATSTRLNSSR